MGNENGHFREFGRFRLDADRRVLWFAGEPVSLPLKEIEILCVLTENSGQVVTKDEILNRVWADSFVEESNLSRHIYLLRKTFKDYGETADLIKTVPRRGYRFAGEVNYNGHDRFVVERHSISETIIEQIDDSEVANLKQVAAKRRIAVPFGIATVAILLAATAGIFLYTRNSQAPTIRSIAVLPFKTINAENGDDQRGIGLADVLITRLSNIKQVNVRPTSAIYEFNTAGVGILEAGQKLGVDAILEGTIYQSGEKMRVTAQLVRLADQKILWSGNFEQVARDELRIQDEIALQVTNALTVNLSQNESNAITKNLTSNEEAYDLYQKGRYSWNKRNDHGFADAERFFQSAIERDPNFALAYVGLADVELMGADSNKAKLVLDKAIEIDPNLAEAQASLGFFYIFHRWNWNTAEGAFKKSIEQKPGYGTAHQWYATYLMIRGQHEQAIAELNRALEINPNSHAYLTDLAQAYYFARDYETAESYCRRALEIYPNAVGPRDILLAIYFQTSNYERVISESVPSALAFYDTRRDDPAVRDAVMRNRQRYSDALRNGGPKEFLGEYLYSAVADKEINPNSLLIQSWILGKMGEKQKALDALEKGVERRAFMSPFVNVDPRYDELRDEPRFAAIMRKMNL